MEGLVTRQLELLESIKKIKVNFTKDPAVRKTPDYIQKRVDSLNNLWGDFEQNHSKLIERPELAQHYISGNYYSQGSELYHTTRLLLTSYGKMEDKATQPSGKVDELIALQRTNFRAFNRLIKSIDINVISEKWELEDELKNVQNRWSSIDSLHMQIDHIVQGGDVSYEDEFTAYETSYRTIKRVLNKKLSSVIHVQQATPQLDIPAFSGKYSQWPTFYDLYTEAIHTNNSISKAQKMQHLKGKVRGEPERLIQHLHISAENYDAAWEILVHRYNNPQVLFTNQIEILLNQPNINKQSSFELKKLYDTTTECIHAIHNLGVDTNSWDPLLVHLLCKMLDPTTYSDYKEARKTPRELPTLEEFLSFIETKFIALEPIKHKTENPGTSQSSTKNVSKRYSNNSSSDNKYYNNKKHYHAVATCTSNCILCNTQHDLYSCRQFKNMTPEKRLATVITHNYCKNCLYHHKHKQCFSNKRCKECQADHNTLLHDAFMRAAVPIMASSSSLPKSQITQAKHNVNHVATDNEEILLTTMTLNVLSSEGKYITLRALLDQGSQISLISERATQMLGLQRRHYQASISGIGPVSKQSKGIVSLECQSIYGDYYFSTQALIVSRVISNLPNSSFNNKNLLHLQHLKLADPQYNVSRPIDILLDASVYSEIIMGGLIKGSSQAPIAQQTKLGWILSGNVKKFNCFAITNLGQISKYWELEDLAESSLSLTSDEQYCEDFYINTTFRTPSGRYEVGLPMKPGFEHELGSSRAKAIAQFHKLEKQFTKDETFSVKYKQFIQEYQDLGHMCQVDDISINHNILPQHGVWKMDSNTTQLRVVFNASSKTSSGKSLNDLMYSGKNLQQDLLSLILKWRTYRFVLTADIEKMFRQILIRKCDQYLQAIIWRYAPNEPFRTYQLSTITYGTKAAPFLAMRTIKQLAKDESKKYPKASSVAQNAFYMDDLFIGQNSISEAKELVIQLISMFKEAGMNLRKWSSNEPLVLDTLMTEQLHNPYEFKCLESRKTLGLRWCPATDTFMFSRLNMNNTTLNKRQLLSEISRIFDPLGWLSPLTIRAKLLFQKAWSTAGSWDEELPTNIQHEWNKLKQDLDHIDKFLIPRHIGSTETKSQLHGFCDASDKAYAGSVYLVTLTDKGEYTSKLVVSKTKLAPLSKKVSLPRLELCGALLLSQLMYKVQESMFLSQSDISTYAWTDSMIVLGWLHGDISKWKTFVANRISKVINIIPSTCWSHVRSEENAADCATRGLSAEQLLQHTLWWEGPTWLVNFNHQVADKQSYQSPLIEIKASVHTALNENVQNQIIKELLFRYSSLSKIIRIVGWIIRFIERIRKRVPCEANLTLTSSESCKAHNFIIRNIQFEDFLDDIQHIKKKGYVNHKSKLSSFDPYIDEHNILRVGGRLRNADLSNSAKHPIILSNHSRLTDLIIKQAHIATLHGGPKLTLAYIRENYWIISGIRTVKRQLRMCVKCRRFQQEIQHQIMSDLPRPRVTPSRPFTHTGIDFTGFVELKANKGRGIKTVKGYVAVFVCFSTKATHLELVSDMGTSAFIAAFRRFCSRRGSPSHVYTDNGTNFVGANRVLKREYREILANINKEFLINTGDMSIKWHFNAPAWPSAGGLWEAAVKSVKYHLKRVLGTQKLTFEEFTTLLHQIEACLNSRPLCPLTENPDDEFLTPGHFLIGGPLLSRPHTEQHAITYNLRWQLVQSMMRSFWKKWSSEYLQQLQARTKWRKPTKNIEVNDIVLIKEENQPPGMWSLGKVESIHPGKDGNVRVVSLKTSKNIIQRPVSKLVLLPVNADEPNHEVQQNKQSPIDTSRSDQKRSTRSRKHLSFYTLLLFIFMLPGVHMSTYNVTPVDKQQAFYFDKITDLQIIRDDWNLVVYYNMSTYWRGISDVTKYINHLREISKEVGSQFDSVMLQLDHELSEIEHYNVVIKGHNIRRKKRGLINGMGYVANALFGVLDERFAEQYKNDIEHIQHNENHLKNLLKNQTSVLESEYNIMRRNEQIMNKQFNLINQHLRNVSEENSKIRFDFNNALYLTSSALAANIIVSSLQRIQQSIMDTVTDISHGRINYHIIAPEQLQQQINIISGQLHGSQLVPVSSSSITDLYQIIKASARIHCEYLIIELKIPLLSSDIYELDAIITIPQASDEKHIYMTTTAPYIAYNLQKDTAMLLSENDLNSCTYINGNKRLLCSLDKPAYSLKIKQSLCDLKSVSHEFTCYSHVISCNDQWFKLHQSNSWFYSCCQECRLRLFCSFDTTLITLNKSGILQLGQGCTLKSDFYSIYAHSNFLHQWNLTPDIKAPQISVLNKFIDSYSSEMSQSTEIPKSDWDQLRNQIDTLKEQSAGELSIHDVHHYYAIYMIVVLLLIFGGILGYIVIKVKRVRNTSIARHSNAHSSGSERGGSDHFAPKVTDAANVVRSESVFEMGNLCSVPKECSKSVMTVNKGTSPLVMSRSADLNAHNEL